MKHKTNSFQYVRNLSNSKLAKVIGSNQRYRLCQRGAARRKDWSDVQNRPNASFYSSTSLSLRVYVSSFVYNFLQYLPVFLHYLDTLNVSCNAYSKEVFFKEITSSLLFLFLACLKSLQNIDTFWGISVI